MLPPLPPGGGTLTPPPPRCPCLRQLPPPVADALQTVIEKMCEAAACSVSAIVAADGERIAAAAERVSADVLARAVATHAIASAAHLIRLRAHLVVEIKVMACEPEPEYGTGTAGRIS